MRRRMGSVERFALGRHTCVLLAFVACASAEGMDSGDGGRCSAPVLASPLAPTASSTEEQCQSLFTTATPPLAARPVGWASVSDLGLGTTNGGEGGERLLVTSIEQLNALRERDDPIVVLLCGDLGDGVQRVRVPSNTTLIGIGDRPTFRGSLEIEDEVNVVVRNLFVEGAACADSPSDCSGGADAVTVRGSHHVWLDHLDVSDGSDGNLDITSGSDYVTVSWSRFSYQNRNRPHRFSNLVGADDGATEDQGHLRVTWHHNWWAEGVEERMPRTRYGDIHVFNNYYSAAGNSKCIEAGFQSRVLVEHNFFDGVNRPMLYSGGGHLLEQENHYRLVSGVVSASGQAFEPPYVYAVDPVCDVPSRVVSRAGPVPDLE